MSWVGWSWLTAFALLVGFLIAFGGCAHHESTLQRMNREVQDCILSGGTAHAGPDNTIECAF